MTKSKNTKRALLMSVLSMILCMAMLAGSTFAWFTDSVTSGMNRIVAGNLDIELEYRPVTVDQNGTTTLGDWTAVPTDKSLFKSADETLWEPGHTEYVCLRIRNAGTLALKYIFSINVTGTGENGEEKEYTSVIFNTEKNEYDTFLLSDYLVFNQTKGVAEISKRDDLWLENAEAEKKELAKEKADRLAALSGEGVLPPSETEEMTLAVYMPTCVGNEANQLTSKREEEGAPTIYLGLDLVATQAVSESDSFGNDYDKNAEYYSIGSAERVKALSAQGYTVVSSEDDIPQNAEKIVLSGDITLNNIHCFADNAVFDANGHTVTMNHLYAFTSPDSKNGSEKGAKNITIKNAVFEKGDTASHAIFSVGSATFENCTFNETGPYITPNTDVNISVKNCVFNDRSLQICWGEGENVDPTTISTEITGNTFNYMAKEDTNSAIALNAGAYSDFSKVNVSNNIFNNKGVTAFSAIYITKATAESIVKNYGNNVENNATVGYYGSDGYGRIVVDEEASYVVFDSGTKILTQVTADTEEYTVPTDVTELGDFVFSSNPTVKKVTVPANVTDLGRGFDTSSVEEVILSEGLETISSRAFRNTPNLKNLVIPSTVTTIVENAFQTSGIEQIVIPASVTSIGFSAFQHCEQMKTVTIEGNPVIANYAFRACASLTDVYLKGEDVKFANGISMVFSVAENNNDNSQITIHVVNETVKARVEAVTRGNINIVID